MCFYGDVAAFEKRLAACEADLRSVCQDYVALEREMTALQAEFEGVTCEHTINSNVRKFDEIVQRAGKRLRDNREVIHGVAL